MRFLLIEAAKKNKAIDLDSGSYERDFLYISDFLDAIEKSLAFKKGKAEVLNIASGISTRINKVAEIIIDKLNSKSVINDKNQNKNSRIQNPCLYADITRAKKF